MSTEQKIQVVNEVKEHSRFFQIRIVLSIFGHVILDYTWPPKKS